MEKGKIVINTGAVIVKDDKILLVQEAEEPFRGKWNFPLGKIEYGEKVMGTIIREAGEETG
jgi:ADP-ribose pyrophosphatase YjhB (NUDIX family)